MIPAQRSHLSVAALSHEGQSGKNNEDRYAVSAFQLEGELTIPSVLAVVADGIGGHRAGEVAAELAIETICDLVAQSDASQPVQILEQAIVRAGHVVYTASQSDNYLRGMGTTCACVWIIGDKLYTAAVGDSRIYLIRGLRIQQLTRDHTWVQEAIDRGVLKPDQARRHPNAHVIRRYLGSKQVVVPDVHLSIILKENGGKDGQGARLQPGDVVLLCTDGLTDLVAGEEIFAVVEKYGLDAGVKELVEIANRRGGHDNITVIALGVPPISRRISIRSRLSYRKRIGAACLAAVFALSILFFGGAFWYLGQIAPLRTAPAPLQLDSQVTLFPDSPGENQSQEMQQGVTSSGSSPAAVIPTQAPSSGTQDIFSIPPPGTSSSDLDATLTPWPTNTP